MLAHALSLASVAAAALAQQPWTLDEYPIGYWCGPPAQYNTLEAWQTVADCNFTVGGMGGDYGLEGNLKMLDYCQQVGIRALLHDHRIHWQMTAADDWKQTIAQVVADYGSHPALYGYFIHDEPSYELFQPLGEISRELQRQDPAHLPYINLFPTYATAEQLGNPTYSDHLDKFLSIVQPAVLSYDHYCLRADGSDGPDYFENLALIREYALRFGVPPWNIIQAMSFAPGAVRQPNDAEMRWQVYTSLAYGMKGIMYFVYWSYSDDPRTVGIVDHEGKPAKLYPIVRQLNREMKVLGRVLLGLTSTGVFHTGEIPMGCTRLGVDSPIALPQELPLLIGFFRDRQGAEWAMIVNRSHREPVEFDARLRPHVVGMTQISATDGSEIPATITDGRLRLRLEPGDGRLFRLTTAFHYREPARPLDRIEFQFDRDGELEGWGWANSLANFAVADGVLTMTITGPDPYIQRTYLRLQPDQYSTIRVRMKLPPCDPQGQLFWITSDSPGFADDKYVNFPVIPDGEWHEYEIPVGDHPMWRAKAVRGIRLDPTTGGAEPGSKVQIDWIVGK